MKTSVNTYQKIEEQIKQRRSQLLIHSYLYYDLEMPIIPDTTWQRWADELVDLQHEYPKNIGWYDDHFNDWDGKTGRHLPRDSWVREKAISILDSCTNQC